MPGKLYLMRITTFSKIQLSCERPVEAEVKYGV
jgi:hypothetical protein